MGLFQKNFFCLSATMSKNKKKTRKLRGHVSHGHGRIGKHRKHPGGRGKAGGQHHHLINFDKYHLGYFGKVGMRYYYKTQYKIYRNILNLNRLWNLVSISQKSKHSRICLTPLIDAKQYGFDKVLGKGQPTKEPLVIKTKYISKVAKAKIEQNGGVVILSP